MKKEKEVCIVKECGNPISIKKHKLCKPHANQLYRDGVVQAKRVRKNKKHDVVIFV